MDLMDYLFFLVFVAPIPIILWCLAIILIETVADIFRKDIKDSA